MFSKKKKPDTKNCRIVDELLSPDERTNADAIQSWRIFRIMSEFVEGFEIVRRYGLAVTFFGSARTTPEDPYYDEAVSLAKRLAKLDFAVITGGGEGIMGAANKGAYETGGHSVGLNIQLPLEQVANQQVTDGQTFEFFFSRKVMLAFASEAYIYFPGGFGTLDEFFEIITLIQTKKIKKIPVVLYGKDFWEPLVEWCRKELLGKFETISPEDMDLFVVVDSVDEAVSYIKKNVKKTGLRQL